METNRRTGMLDHRLHHHTHPHTVITGFVMQSESDLDLILRFPVLCMCKLILRCKDSCHCVHQCLFDIKIALTQSVISGVIGRQICLCHL